MVYSVFKNLILWTKSEFFGAAMGFYIKNHKFQAPNRK
jgi:hypothetical protein